MHYYVHVFKYELVFFVLHFALVKIERLHIILKLGEKKVYFVVAILLPKDVRLN